MSETTGLMQIGELAERTGLSLRTLRHYDEVGLLRASIRSEGGFRLYSADDLSRLLLIRRMKPLGFSLEEMSELLAVIDALDSEDDTGGDQQRVRVDLERFIADTAARRAKLQEQLDMADEFLALLHAR